MALEHLAELCNSARSVLSRHALGAGTNANLDHAALDGVGDVDASLQTRRALPVQALNGCGDGEAGGEGSGTKLSGTSTGGKDRADSDVLDKVGVDSRALDEGLEGAVEEVGALGVLEAALSTLGDGCTKSTCNNDL